jgi:hypothetical protein
MTHWDLSLDDADGNVFRRFSRSQPVEAWVTLRDRDNPDAAPIVCPFTFTPGLPLAAIVRLAISAANDALQLAQIEQVPA